MDKSDFFKSGEVGKNLTPTDFDLKKVEKVRPERLRELTATYFFVYQLIEVAELIQKKKPLSFFIPSLAHMRELFLSMLVTPWLLTNPPQSPNVRDYIKSGEFAERLSHAFLYSLAVFVSVLMVLIPQIANKFMGGFPFGIAGTVIFIFAGSTGSSFSMAKARLGGTLMGDLFVFVFFKIITPNPYSITATATGFVVFMTLISVDFPDIAMVSIFVGLSTLFSNPNTQEFEKYIVSSLLQTLVGIGIILVIYSFKWFTNSTRNLLVSNYTVAMHMLRRAVVHSAFIIDNVGGEEAMVEFDFKSSFPLVHKARDILAAQIGILSEVQSEPSFWRPPVRIDDNKVIIRELKSICEHVEWLACSRRVPSCVREKG